MQPGGPVQIPKLAGYDLEENRDLLLNETLNAYAMTPFLRNGIVTWLGAVPKDAQGQALFSIDAATVRELLTPAPQPTPVRTERPFLKPATASAGRSARIGSATVVWPCSATR
jgi:hypothetical protein